MNTLKAIVLGGLTAGTLDITYAISVVYAVYGIGPMRVFHAIASGWLGREAARAGGIETAILGGVSHFAMTTLMAAGFVLGSFVFRDLLRRPLLWGSLYGAGLFFLMNYVVVPNSAIGKVSTPPWPWMYSAELLVHMIFVGVPIALIARWMLSERAMQPAQA